LKEYLKERKKSAMKFIIDAAKLIVGSIEEDILSGYDWIIAMLKTANLQEIESEIEICKAVNYIKSK
jgi:intraflagellar transport protein 88